MKTSVVPKLKLVCDGGASEGALLSAGVLGQLTRRGARMPKDWEVLLVCCGGEPADNLVELVTRAGARAELALTLGHGIVRLHRHQFAGIIVDAREGEAATFVEQARAEGIRLPIFAVAARDSACAVTLLEVEDCVVCLARVGLPEELRQWLLALARAPDERAVRLACETPPAEGQNHDS